eukprot:sb/3472569/
MRSLIGVLFVALAVQSVALPERLEKREQRTEIIYTNVAEGKETKQSSTGWGGVSSRAVDGETSGNWGHGSCTHGNNRGLQWWEVDLGANYNISYIENNFANFASCRCTVGQIVAPAGSLGPSCGLVTTCVKLSVIRAPLRWNMLSVRILRRAWEGRSVSRYWTT